MNNYYDGSDMKFDNKEVKQDTMSQNMGCCAPVDPCGCKCDPVYECPQERVVNRCINIEVSHVMPCNTRVVNHYVYHHTFTPCYTCCEENVVSNVYDNRCC